MTETKPQTALLSDLAAKIKAAHNEVVNATRGVVGHAVACGEHLHRAKNSFAEHGEWLSWLKVHCELEVRTAQRYMRLAKNKDKLEAFSKTSGLTDLNLTKAYQLLANGEPVRRDDDGSNANDSYGKAQKSLLERLKKLDASTAEAAATETIRQITEVVATKTGSRWRPKMAA